MKLPLLIGGSGEKRTLRIVARDADIWNGEGDPETFARKNAILDQHCAEIGRAMGKLELREKRLHRLITAMQNEAHDCAEAGWHLAFCQIVLGMRCQPGIIDAGD